MSANLSKLRQMFPQMFPHAAKSGETIKKMKDYDKNITNI